MSKRTIVMSWSDGSSDGDEFALASDGTIWRRYLISTTNMHRRIEYIRGMWELVTDESLENLGELPQQETEK